jgi:hypothetical protein
MFQGYLAPSEMAHKPVNLYDFRCNAHVGQVEFRRKMYIWLERVHSIVMRRELTLNSEDHFPLMFEYIFDAAWYWCLGPVAI